MYIFTYSASLWLSGFPVSAGGGVTYYALYLVPVRVKESQWFRSHRAYLDSDNQ